MKNVQAKPVTLYTDSEITKIVISDDNKTYFLGCKDGSVHLLSSDDLHEISDFKNG